MALGPRLDLRQSADSGHDAATASGHQAAAIFQRRGHHLRRGGAGTQSAAGARRRRRSADHRAGRAWTRCRSAPTRPADAAQMRAGGYAAHPKRQPARYRSTPKTYDAGGVADGATMARSRSAARRQSRDFDGDDRGIEDIADERRPLRDHLGEQLRLSFADPVDRMIGAHLIALLCPAGRLTADPAAIAEAMAIAAGAGRGGACAHDALRPGRPVRARPEGMPGGAAGRARTGSIRRWRRCSTIWNCWRGAILRRLMSRLRRRCRGPGRHDRRDPRARSEARRRPTTSAPAQRSCPIC